jgi:hypothetical protein
MQPNSLGTVLHRVNSISPFSTSKKFTPNSNSLLSFSTSTEEADIMNNILYPMYKHELKSMCVPDKLKVFSAPLHLVVPTSKQSELQMYQYIYKVNEVFPKFKQDVLHIREYVDNVYKKKLSLYESIQLTKTVYMKMCITAKASGKI